MTLYWDPKFEENIELERKICVQAFIYLLNWDLPQAPVVEEIPVNQNSDDTDISLGWSLPDFDQNWEEKVKEDSPWLGDGPSFDPDIFSMDMQDILAFFALLTIENQKNRVKQWNDFTEEERDQFFLAYRKMLKCKLSITPEDILSGSSEVKRVIGKWEVDSNYRAAYILIFQFLRKMLGQRKVTQEERENILNFFDILPNEWFYVCIALINVFPYEEDLSYFLTLWSTPRKNVERICNQNDLYKSRNAEIFDNSKVLEVFNLALYKKVH